MSGGAPVAAALGGVVLFLAAGRGLVELLPALRQRPLAARLGWAYLLGVAAVPGMVYLLGIVFDVRIRRGVVLAPAILLVLAGLFSRVLRGKAAVETPRPPRAGRLAARAAFAVAAAAFIGLILDAATHRELGWDAEMTWSAAARWVRADRSVTPRAILDADAFVDHPQYPLLLPLAQVAVQETFDSSDDPRVIKPLYAAFFPALLLVFFDLARRHAGTAAAALTALALAVTPYLAFEHSGGAAGAYSDVPLGAFLGAGLLLLLGRPRASEGAAAAVLLAAAVLTKNEGLPFAAVALVAGGLAAALDRPADRTRRLRALALAAGAVLAAALALHAWKAKVPQRWDEDYTVQLRTVSLAHEAAARLPLLPRAAAIETVSWDDWSGLWVAAGVTLLAGASGLRRRVAPPLLVAAGGCLAFYVGALLLTPWRGAEQVHPTWNRLLLQLACPLGLLVALALRAGLRARPAALAFLSGADRIPAMSEQPSARARAFLREALVFLAFLALTVAMTWPWARHLRDYCSDTGDPYLNSWILWWDWHQTFHAPLHLFDGNIYFPYKLSLAFSEHNYGLALPLFPLFALGLRPLTAQGILTLLGFAFSGYGAFRLGRTLTGSTGAAWVTGIAFAFVPYRFGQLPHVNYLFAGWIPILFEALVLFLRERSARRAKWLGAAFFLNGLAVVHWLVLTLVPLAAVALVLAFRTGVERDRTGWKRAALALGVATLALLPFLLPYQRAAKLYGFTRSLDEARDFSAEPHDWMNADPRNQLWRGFSQFPSPGERSLFPGLLLLALPLAALLLSPSPRGNAPAPAGSPPSPRLLRWLDGIAIAAGFLAIFAASPTGIHLRYHGREIFRATDPARALVVFTAALALRWWLAYPAALPLVRARNIPESLRLVRRPDAIVVGFLLALLGFFGSLGVRFPFHRILFEAVFLFRSIRVPARWATIAYLGLAILAGVAVQELAARWKRRRPGARTGAAFAAVCVALLLEDRAAPLDLVRGEADPDEATRFLAKTPMAGGLVELPSGDDEHGNYRAVLRAADHGKPLVTAVSGFSSPLISRIEEDERKAPIPDDLLDLLEKIPTSYVLVRGSWLSPAMRTTHREWIDRALASGRLVFVKRFDGDVQNDLFAVAKNEPSARALEPLPWTPPAGLSPSGAPWREDGSLTGAVDVPAEGATGHGSLRVEGWARIPGEDLDVTILVDGEARTPAAARRIPRPDVCTAVAGLGDCARAGYEATYAFRPGDAGPHEVVAIFRSKDGRQRHYGPQKFVWKP
ncbi:MAG TPA: hypothetical protein VMV60_06830 [Thermoanaerobaculia bacterium]|nr:hypothetical protein [Thermoanaerobaculia bacterium]